MQIHILDKPAVAAGTYIGDVINSHRGDVLCLLAGGSALALIKYIKIDGVRIRNECRTMFIMGDERVSGGADNNNFLQLVSKYPNHAIAKQLIETVPQPNELAEDFAYRIEKTILQIISEAENLKIISLLGLGEDGHTAGIFPMDQKSFQETYRDDRTYVPVHAKGLTIDSRASITPTWLLTQANEIILYVAGNKKRAILEALLDDSKELHERPAELIKQHQNAHVFTDIHFESK